MLLLPGALPLLLLVPLLAGATPAGGGATPALTIVVNPGRFAGIEAAARAEAGVDWWDDATADDDACTECFAATELRRFAAACLRIPESSIRLATPDAMPGRGAVVLIGSRRSNSRIAALGGPVAPARGEGFRLSRRDSGDRAIYVIEGGSRVGSLYGTYAFLERLGMRFFGLGEMGTIVPRSRVALPDTIDRAESPGYETRGFWAWEPRGNREFFLWMARNRMNLWTAEERDRPLLEKLGIRLVAGGHQIQKVCLDPARYFASHPEWYAQIGGRRSARVGNETGDNFDTSNPEAVRQLASNLVIELSRGRWRQADALAFWMLDAGRWCECRSCAAQGSPTDRLFGVLGVVSDSIEAARRDGRIARPVRVTTMAFLETAKPPARKVPAGLFGGRFAVTYFPIDRCYAHALGDPACAEINRAFARELDAWTSGSGRSYTGAIEIGEYYNLGELKSLPPGVSRAIAADVPWYFRHGARHFHTMHALTADWGTWTPDHVLLARLLWNPDAAASAVLDDFFARYYPTTASQSRRFHERLEAAMSNAKLLKQRVRGPLGIFDLRLQMRHRGDVYPLDHFRRDGSTAPEVAPDMAAMLRAAGEARVALDRAFAECRDAAERQRLEDDRRRFEYGAATLEFYDRLLRLYALDLAGDSTAARAAWPALQSTGERLKAMTRVVQASSSHANAHDALEATRMSEFYERYRNLYGAALTPPATPSRRQP